MNRKQNKDGERDVERDEEKDKKERDGEKDKKGDNERYEERDGERDGGGERELLVGTGCVKLSTLKHSFQQQDLVGHKSLQFWVRRGWVGMDEEEV